MGITNFVTSGLVFSRACNGGWVIVLDGGWVKESLLLFLKSLNLTVDFIEPRLLSEKILLSVEGILRSELVLKPELLE